MQCAARAIDLAQGRGRLRRDRPPGTGRYHHPPGPPAQGPDSRRGRRRYALIAAARKPRVTRPLLPAPRALTQAAARRSHVADAGGSVSEAMQAVSRRRI